MGQDKTAVQNNATVSESVSGFEPRTHQLAVQHAITGLTAPHELGTRYSATAKRLFLILLFQPLK